MNLFYGFAFHIKFHMKIIEFFKMLVYVLALIEYIFILQANLCIHTIELFGFEYFIHKWSYYNEKSFDFCMKNKNKWKLS